MIPEYVGIWLKEESKRDDLRDVMQSLTGRHGKDLVQAQVMLSVLGPESTNPFRRGTIRAAELPAAEVPVRLWFGLYPRSVVLVIGETGAGKSSMIYNLCIHAARNEPLWGVAFGLKRPLRILYIDPENSGNFAEGKGGQCSVKLDRIGQGRPVELIFHDGQGINLADPLHIAALREYIEQEQIDIVILDPIANLFSTKDENDNAEAARQMTALTALSRQTGACVVAVHHTGKGSSSDYGRGASARLGAADVAIIFRAKGEAEETDDTYNGQLRERDDQCRLQIVKNRIEGRGSLYLQMAGEDRFALSSFEAWKDARHRADPRASQAERAQEEIGVLLADGQWHTRAEILAALQKEGIGQVNIDGALKALEMEHVITSKRSGKGGSMSFISTTALDLQNPILEPAGSFLVFQSTKGNEKLKNLNDGSKEAVDKFFSKGNAEDEGEEI